jgi:hypothetical protein
MAASSRPLADVLVDALRADSKLSRLRATHSADKENAARQQFLLPLEEETEQWHTDEPIRVLHPDDEAAAMVLGKAFERSRDTLARLADPDMVAVIEAPIATLSNPSRVCCAKTCSVRKLR